MLSLSTFAIFISIFIRNIAVSTPSNLTALPPIPPEVRVSHSPSSSPDVSSTTPVPTSDLTLAAISIPEPTVATTTSSPVQTTIPTATPTIESPTQESHTLIPSPSARPTSLLMDEINAYRVALGLAPVIEDPQTCAYALLRAQELVNHFDHNGTTYPYAKYSIVTENIAMTSNQSEVVKMWTNSPTHAENMQKDTPYVCVRNNGVYYAYEGWKP